MKSSASRLPPGAHYRFLFRFGARPPVIASVQSVYMSLAALLTAVVV
jgi:hypothetical protein